MTEPDAAAHTGRACGRQRYDSPTAEVLPVCELRLGHPGEHVSQIVGWKDGFPIRERWSDE